MALAFGVDFDPEDMSAPHVRSDPAPWVRPAASFAHRWLARFPRAPVRSALNVSPETSRRENASIATAFDRLSDIIGLTGRERSMLSGVGRDPSRVILALETLGAALDLCGAPDATLDWLRGALSQAPFHGRAPMALFAADGQFGVEIALLYLRARSRPARCLAAR